MKRPANIKLGVRDFLSETTKTKIARNEIENTK
jgi:hypothetical protein